MAKMTKDEAIKRLENAEQEIAECKAFLEELDKPLTFADLDIGDSFFDDCDHSESILSIKTSPTQEVYYSEYNRSLSLFTPSIDTLVKRV